MTPSTRNDSGQPVAPPDAGANGTHPAPSPADEVEVGTPEYDRLNARRIELGYKKNRVPLTEAEEAEYEYVDRVVTAAVDRRYPRAPFLTDEQRAYVRRLLGVPDEPPGR